MIGKVRYYYLLILHFSMR